MCLIAFLSRKFEETRNTLKNIHTCAYETNENVPVWIFHFLSFYRQGLTNYNVHNVRVYLSAQRLRKIIIIKKGIARH